MERKSVLLGVAVVLAGYSAFAHLGIGLAEVLGSVPDGSLTVIPVLFILSAVVVGLFLVSLARGVAIPTIYLVGGVLMILHLIAYVDVHAFGYLEAATGVDLHGHDGGHENAHSHDTAHESVHANESGDHAHSDDGHDHESDGHAHEDGEAEHTHDDGTTNHTHDDGGDGHGHADGDGQHADDEQHTHDDETAGEVLVSHLRDDLTALSTKIAETGSAIAFLALYILER